jgi:hypothetical protein
MIFIFLIKSYFIKSQYFLLANVFFGAGAFTGNGGGIQVLVSLAPLSQTVGSLLRPLVSEDPSYVLG